MSWFKPNKEDHIIPMTLQYYICKFKTIDGELHKKEYKWYNKKYCICSVPEYLAIESKEKGFIYDEDDVMYPLTNVISIKWELVEEKKCVEELNKYGHYYWKFQDGSFTEI